MIIAGGYYRGFETMAISLSSLIIPGSTQNFQWSYLGYLPEERQWAPALGLVAGKPTIATGIAISHICFFNSSFLKKKSYYYFSKLLGENYGDVTIATLENEHHWMDDNSRRLRFRREFSTSISLPHTWMPSVCDF